MKRPEWLERRLTWIRDRVPPGIRTVVGLALLVGGVLGFLPVVGFWMIPLGLMVIALDVGPLLRALRRCRRRTPGDEGKKEDRKECRHRSN